MAAKPGAETPTTTGTVQDTQANREVAAILETPEAIYKENVKDVVADGYTTAANLCTTPELKAACEKYGVS